MTHVHLQVEYVDPSPANSAKHLWGEIKSLKNRKGLNAKTMENPNPLLPDMILKKSGQKVTVHSQDAKDLSGMSGTLVKSPPAQKK